MPLNLYSKLFAPFDAYANRHAKKRRLSFSFAWALLLYWLCSSLAIAQQAEDEEVSYKPFYTLYQQALSANDRGDMDLALQLIEQAIAIDAVGSNQKVVGEKTAKIRTKVGSRWRIVDQTSQIYNVYNPTQLKQSIVAALQPETPADPPVEVAVESPPDTTTVEEAETPEVAVAALAELTINEFRIVEERVDSIVDPGEMLTARVVLDNVSQSDARDLVVTTVLQQGALRISKSRPMTSLAAGTNTTLNIQIASQRTELLNLVAGPVDIFVRVQAGADGNLKENQNRQLVLLARN